MKKIWLVLLFLVPVQAHAFSCDVIRWAEKNLPKELIDEYIKHATPEQIKEGKACFEQEKHRKK